MSDDLNAGYEMSDSARVVLKQLAERPFVASEGLGEMPPEDFIVVYQEKVLPILTELEEKGWAEQASCVWPDGYEDTAWRITEEGRKVKDALPFVLGEDAQVVFRDEPPELDDWYG